MQKEQIRLGLFDFFRELKENNNREWFAENRQRYEEVVREPLLQFIREFDFRLKAISSSFVADPRRSGGSLFRIYRDTRFSKDKSPYKTAAGIQFRHKSAKNVHAPGFYLHLQPGSCFAGMGIWHPDTATLLKVRRAIVKQSDRWREIFGETKIRQGLRLGGDSLVRAPKGFDPDHPLIEDLKRKDFVLFRELSERDIVGAQFIDEFAGICRTGTPFMRFLTDALGLEW